MQAELEEEANPSQDLEAVAAPASDFGSAEGRAVFAGVLTSLSTENLERVLRCVPARAGAGSGIVVALVARVWGPQRPTRSSVCVSLARYVREWNTAARTSLIAQKVLQHVMLHVPADVLRKVDGIEEFVAHMAPYTERHFEVRPVYVADRSRMHTAHAFAPVVPVAGACVVVVVRSAWW